MNIGTMAGLGQGLQQGIGTYLALKQLKQQQEQHQGRLDSDLIQQGYTVATPQELQRVEDAAPRPLVDGGEAHASTPKLTLSDPNLRAGFAGSMNGVSSNDSSISYPQDVPNIVTVGGRQYVDHRDKLLDFIRSRAEALYAPRAESALALQGVKGGQHMHEIAARGENQLNLANVRGGFQVQTTGMRTAQSRENNVRSNNTRLTIHNTPNTPGGGSSLSPLVHQGAFVNKQLDDTQKQIKELGKQTEYPLSSRASPADSANYNAAAEALPKLRHTADSLRNVLGGIGARMSGQQAPQATPAFDSQAAYNEAAQKYKRAIDLGVDSASARQAYDADVLDIARRSGQVK